MIGGMVVEKPDLSTNPGYKFPYGLLPKESKGEGFGNLLAKEQEKLNIQAEIEKLKKEQNRLRFEYIERMEAIDREIAKLEDMEVEHE